MSDTVIKVEHLSKYYKLGVINNGALFKDIQTWFALKTGRQDPHSRIGEHKYDGNAEGFWALKDLDFEIHQGDRVGIIGKNGAGKSTLLKILSRITAPTEGSVKIKGRVASLLEVGTGFHGELTGRENIYLNGAILGMKRAEVTRKLDEIIAFSEIEQHIDTPVKRYSSGMYVRLAFAVAAHLDSEILIADEVLAVGDASFQKKALGKMNDLSTGEGRTVLFVSHNMGSIKNLCNKGIILNSGTIIDNGNITSVIKRYDQLTAATLDIANLQDKSISRQTGDVFIKDVEFEKTEYFFNEDIRLSISILIKKQCYGLYLSIFILNETEEIVGSIPICLSTSGINAGYRKKICLSIPAKSITPGRYPLYFWLGDELAYSQGTPTNCHILDKATQPLVIKTDNDTEKLKNIAHILQGYVSIKPEINILSLSE